MTFAYLGGIPFKTEPDQVSWQYQMKTRTHKTVGGKVIQILGVTMGDLTVSGLFGQGQEAEVWENQLAFRDQIIKYVRRAEHQGFPTPIRFTYTPRNWDFQVFIKGMSAISFSNEEVAPRWQLLLMADEDATADIAKGIKDLYIQRLMAGIGWKQTDYNGPSNSELQALLAGKTKGEYLAGLAQDAFNAGLQNGQITGSTGTTATGGTG